MSRQPARRRPSHGGPGERGSVTAETATVLPVLVAAVVGLVWLLSLGVTQLRVVDAARETARAVARDEATARAVSLGERVAPDGARIAVEPGSGTVVVRVSAPVRGPGGLFAVLPEVDVDARAVTAQEDR